MNTAIFGGSFDPAHQGHFEIVRQVLNIGNMAKVILVPAYQNPLKTKQPLLPEAVRWKILEETFSDLKTVEISDFELRNRDFSYMHLTLDYFRKKYRKDQLHLIMGEDAFASFHLWAEVDRILESVKILVFQRPALRKKHPESHRFSSCPKVEWTELKIPDVSATEIRNSGIATIERKSWLHPNALDSWKEFKES